MAGDGVTAVGASWLRNLPLELGQIEPKEYLEPLDEVAPKEQEVGVLSDDLRQLFTLSQLVTEQAERLAVDVRHARTAEIRDENVPKARELTEKAHALRALFWISVRDYLHLWSDNRPISFGVRKGFRVVVFEDEESHPHFRFMG